jgi:hypothetical protein
MVDEVCLDGGKGGDNAPHTALQDLLERGRPLTDANSQILPVRVEGFSQFPRKRALACGGQIPCRLG